MQKVLVISYFFPPCNLTAANRSASWKKHLPENGYSPIVLTRNWWQNAWTEKDLVTASDSNCIEVEKDKEGEVHKLPYTPNLRDRLLVSGRLPFLRKMLTFLELIWMNFSLKGTYLHAYQVAAEKIIKEDPTIQKVLITGSPFQLFRIGYSLKRKFPNIEWVADYRDDWNTSNINETNGFLGRIVVALESRSEQKWLKTASAFTTISKVYQEKIERFIDRPGFVVLNGFDEIQPTITTPNNVFRVLYNGSLYPTQPIEPFLEAFKKIISNYSHHMDIQMFFPGIGTQRGQLERISKATKGFEAHFILTDRISRSEVLQMQGEASVLLMIAHAGVKGIPSSKLYEYLSFQKPILLYPNDHDILEETLLDSELGLICNRSEEIYEALENQLLQKQKENTSPVGKPEKLEKYSRASQTKSLAAVLNQLKNA